MEWETLSALIPWMWNGERRDRKSDGAAPQAETFKAVSPFATARRGNSVWESARLKISKSPVRSRPAA